MPSKIIFRSGAVDRLLFQEIAFGTFPPSRFSFRNIL